MLYALLLLIPALGLLDFGSDDPGPDEDDPPNPDPDPDPDPDQDILRTGQFVPDLFGANVIFSINTEDGVPTETLESSLDVFEFESLRFPGGEAEPRGTDGEDSLDITQLTESGELVPELVNFMENVEANVTLVIPTGGSTVEDYGEGLAEWSETVLNQYGDRIDAFEIGNEYWGRMGETEYGQKADIAIQELSSGIGAAQQGDPSILVQMATPTSESEFSGDVDNRGFLTRLEDANNTIIDQLSETSRAQVDGVVEHYYWNNSPVPFEDSSAEVRNIDRDFEIWQDRLGRELELHITEWNITSANDDRTGVQSLSILTEMVENMVELGVDDAQIWPINHNTTNDIGGSFDIGTVATDDQGRVVETVRGAIFHLMANSLPGKELVELELADAPGIFEIAAYEGDGELVLYLGSHSLEPADMVLDLTDIAPNFQSATGVQVGYDPATSDGRSYVPGESILPDESVQIDGKPYYLTEHDTQALLTDLEFEDPRIDVRLLPYEVLELTIRS